MRAPSAPDALPAQLADALEAFAPELPSQAEEMASDRAAIARVRADQPGMKDRLEASQERVEAAKALLQATEPVADTRTQAEKFADLARELECDESEEGFDERLGRLARTPTPSNPKQD